MCNYSKRSVNIISLCISSVVFFIVVFSFQTILANVEDEDNIEVFESEVPEEVQQVSENVEENVEESVIQTEEPIECEWEIEIPVINLKAVISEGTDESNLNKFVGHFENTSKFIGNVGLAAHNRGYAVNYFANVKKLKKGDEIIYKYNNNVRKYKVDVIEVIKDTDWSYLENTEKNKITLITCVEDAPMYRRCVQGIES